MKEKIIKDKRLLNWLNNRGITSQNDLRDFLNPTYFQLLNPHGLLGINEACKIIKEGIAQSKRFVIVGDYDCDGIMASTVMYQYLISKNANVQVFIPNRFEDGYGLNLNLIDEILLKANPDIVITVDLGITCMEEVEYFKSKGVTVIVTDHHEPQEVLPDCILIDPKIEQEYACSYLCGTGVAFKLVSALAGKEFANNFLDIVAIATIGDIVPLLGENRVIASLGLERISKKQFSLESVKFLFETLKLEKVTSSDIYLKIVPKINASGRMDNAFKVFNFLNSKDENEIHNLLSEILADNALRLNEINKSVEVIEKQLNEIDVLDFPILCVKGEFHQGILGILASRITGDYNKPSIVFAKTDKGTYKASGRSIEGVDLHSIILKNSHLCEHFGGHKMAVGLEVKEENYDEFVSSILTTFSEHQFVDEEISNNQDEAIEISEEDINEDFISQVNMLAPFGCNNEKPEFKITVNSEIKSTKLGANNSTHLKLDLGHGANVVYFNGLQHKEMLSSKAKKELIVDIDFNYYKNKAIPQAIVRKLTLLEPIGIENKTNLQCSGAIYLSKSLLNNNLNDNTKVHYLNENLNDFLKNFASSKFGTLVIGNTNENFASLKNVVLSNFIISDVPQPNKQNTILLNSVLLLDFSKFNGYKNLIFLNESFENQYDFLTSKFNVYVLNKNEQTKIYIYDIRQKCAQIFTVLKSDKLDVYANDLIDFSNKIHNLLPQIAVLEICICLLGLEELGIINFNNDINFTVSLNNCTKKDLYGSVIFNYFRRS